MNTADLNCIITGAGRGIGRATALYLLAGGASVALWERDRTALDSFSNELIDAGFDRERFVGIVCDVTKATDRERALERTLSALPALNGLINNAGTFVPGTFRQVPISSRRQEIEVNFTALVELTYAVLPYLQQRQTGVLVNVSSAAAYAAPPGLAVYSATKAAVWMFTEGLRNEALAAGKRNVHYASVHPNYVRQGLFGHSSLGGISEFLFPSIRTHRSVARALVSRAIRKERTVVSIPGSLRITVFVRGILPDNVFHKLCGVLGLRSSSWNSEKGESGT